MSNIIMQYKPTTKSAIEYANSKKLEKWIHLFLCGEGNNKAFSDGLKLEPRKYHAPAIMDLSKFERCCGPENYMKYKVSDVSFNIKVDEIIKRYKKGDWDMPPLIINHTENRYELNDGNHRFEALKRLDINNFWIIIWETI